MISNERRTEERVCTNLEAHWEGAFSSQDGIITDLSSGGCFVLTADDVHLKELIRLEVELPTGRQIFLWGEVVYRVEDMGFGLRFTGVEETEERMLGALLAYAREEWEAREAAREQQQASAPSPTAHGS